MYQCHKMLKIWCHCCSVFTLINHIVNMDPYNTDFSSLPEHGSSHWVICVSIIIHSSRPKLTPSNRIWWNELWGRNTCWNGENEEIFSKLQASIYFPLSLLHTIKFKLALVILSSLICYLHKPYNYMRRLFRIIIVRWYNLSLGCYYFSPYNS